MHRPTTTTRDFIAALQPHAGKQLVFDYAGKRIQPGYHVTEIKAAAFRSLDCGANPQQWNETVVQLWDVAGKPDEHHMTVKKFLAIYSKVDADVRLDGEAEIKFECGDAVTPAVHYTLDSMHHEDDALVVSLEPVRAACKPRDRWWMEKAVRQGQPGLQATSSCCASASASELIQIADAAPVASAACCGNGARC